MEQHREMQGITLSKIYTPTILTGTKSALKKIPQQRSDNSGVVQ